MIGVIAGQTMGFAFGLGTAFAGFGGVMAMAIGNVKALYEKNAKLNAQQQATKVSIDKIKTTYEGLVKATQKPILEGVQKGAQVATTLLNQLKPMFMSSAQVFNGLMTSLKQSIGTPPVQQFIEYLNAEAPLMLLNFGKAIGNLFKGLASMFVAFTPLTESVSAGFSRMAESFATWAQGLQKSEKFKSFISYVQENMPKISSIFGNAIVGVVNFFAAFGGSASGMMTSLQGLMERWRAWTAALGENQSFQKFLSYVSATAPGVMSLIGNLTTFLVNLGIGMAPLGAILLEMVNKFLAWSNSMMQAHPAIGQIIAIVISLSGAFMAIMPVILMFKALFAGLGTAMMSGIGKAITFITGLFTSFSGTLTTVGTWVANLATKFPMLGTVISLLTGPVGLVIAAIAVFVGVLIGVYQTSETFRNQVSTAFTAVWNVIQTAFGAVASFLSTTWAQIMAIWTANSANIMTIGTVVWGLIKDTITTTMSQIMMVFQTVWPLISTIVQVAWEVIKAVITTSVAIISGVLTALTNLLTGNWSAAWNAIKAMLTTIWNAIVSAAKNIFNILKSFLLGIWNSIKGPTTSVWNGIKSTLTSIWNSIKSTATTVFNAVKTAITNAWNTIKSTTTSVWNGIKSAITTAWNAIKSATTTAINGIKSAVTNGFNAIKSAITNAMNAIKSGISSAWSAIKSVVSSAISAIKSVVTSGFSAVRSAVSSAMSAVKSVITSAWSAITSAVSSAVSTIKNTVVTMFNSLKSAVSSAMNGVVSAIKSGWQSAQSFLSSIDLTAIGRHIIQGLVNGIKSMAGAVIGAAKSIADKVKSTIKSAMDIHSPSRVTYALGEHTGQGFANGITSKTKVVTASAKKTANAAKKAFNDSLKNLDLRLTAGSISTANYVKEAKALGQRYKGVTNAVATVNAKTAKAQSAASRKAQQAARQQYLADQKAFNNKVANLDNKYKANKIGATAYTDEMNKLAKTYNNVTNAASKVAAKTASINKQLFSSKMTQISNNYQNGEYTIEKYLKKLEQTKEKYKSVKGAETKVDKEIATVRYELNKHTVDSILADETIGANKQIALIKEIGKEYAKGSQKRKYFDEQLQKSKQELYNNLTTLSDTYTTKIQDANNALIESEKKLNEEYEKAVSDRANTIYKSMGLFDEMAEKSATTGAELISNLKSQVAGMSEWAANMETLAGRGVDAALIDELRELGIKSAGEIETLTKMSDTELTEFVGAWKEKSELANKIAVSEMKDLRVSTDAEITKMREETALQLDMYNKEWQQSIKDLTGGTKKTFNAMTASMPAIGKNVIKGMQSGLTDMTPSLLAQAKSIADEVKSTIQQAFDIHSPSKWANKFIGVNIVKGLINGMANMQAQAVKTAHKLAESVKDEVTSNLVSADVLGYTASSTSAISKELSVSVKVEVEGGGNGTGGNVTINNQYDNAPSSPAELARQQKKQMQNLGFGM